MKSISLILLITGHLGMFCYGQQTDTIIYAKPEVAPIFKYDTCSNLIESVKKYFMDNYKMPNVLLDNAYSGRIYVELVIEKDSSVSNVKLLRGIHDPLDKSVMEFIQSMPKWTAGTNNGKTVRARIVLPVSINWLYGKTE
jgi:hypothetical protein